jgi:hypothetical protein
MTNPAHPSFIASASRKQKAKDNEDLPSHILTLSGDHFCEAKIEQYENIHHHSSINFAPNS